MENILLAKMIYNISIYISYNKGKFTIAYTAENELKISQNPNTN